MVDVGTLYSFVYGEGRSREFVVVGLNELVGSYVLVEACHFVSSETTWGPSKVIIWPSQS